MPTRKRNRTALKDNNKLKKFEWSNDQTGFVLAWNEHCIQKGKGRGLFRDTILTELKKEWPHDFSYNDVEKLLRSVHYHYQHYKIVSNRSRAAIYDKGLACLNIDNDADFKQALDRYLVEFGKKRNSRLCRTHTPGTSCTPRSTPTVVKVYRQRLRSSTSNTEFTPQPRHESSNETVENQSSTKTEPATFAKIHFLSASSQEEQSYRNAPISPHREYSVPNSSRSSSLTWVSDSDLERLVPDEKCGTSTEQGTQTSDAEDIEFDRSKASVINDLKLRINQLNGTIVALHGKIQAERQAAADQAESWNHAMKDRSDREQFEHIEKQQKIIISLMNEKGKSRPFIRFCNGTAYSHFTPENLIRDLFVGLFQSSKKIWLHLDDGCREVAQATTSKAIQDWIFQSSWPDLDEDQSMFLRMLLQSFRKVIATCVEVSESKSLKGKPKIDGLITKRAGVKNPLEALESTAHDDVFKESGFRNFLVPIKAEELAKKLVGQVRGQISNCSSGFGNCISLTDWQQKEADVRKLMKKAMDVKEKVILSHRRYFLFCAEPGAVFDPETMSTGSMRGDSEAEASAPIVKLCLSPGLCQYKAHTADDGNSDSPSEWTQSLIRYRISEDTGMSAERTSFVECKAIVLL